MANLKISESKTCASHLKSRIRFKFLGIWVETIKLYKCHEYDQPHISTPAPERFDTRAQRSWNLCVQAPIARKPRPLCLRVDVARLVLLDGKVYQLRASEEVCVRRRWRTKFYDRGGKFIPYPQSYSSEFAKRAVDGGKCYSIFTASCETLLITSYRSAVLVHDC
ncbi:hypothetical protein ACJ72_06012 [Emergomyces africanus]|uniref:Uncharacterized protein n=1 Tax=Emergomyces africanus TaxID=1955775 RepID=A0A1B7NSA0_9EURO|nr:hypothetical protein ACJ72_06012 [Emergomyces africanus]